ncbi:MAG TPA: hypothetical protein PK466_00345 [Thermotogota bacterium]|nr:hypothetical protein [Thermotogota bacterium]HPJ87542.1 hypothetical protein [Thermotogota bacterium]HPR94747.1 hypothetical protein [Thermotogota bacterium]
MQIVKTLRDITVLTTSSDYKDNFMIIACDSIGSIGNKPYDALQVDPRVSAKYCLRVCLNEIYAVGAKPLIIISNVSNEWDVTGKNIYTAIKSECAKYSLDDIQINGSTEENFQTVMTAFSITVIAKAEYLKWKMSEKGDSVYLFGFPRVGTEVLENEEENLNPNDIESLLENYDIHDFIPCGSKGIEKEISLLEAIANSDFLNFKRIHDTIFSKSAGPATCGVFTAPYDNIKERNVRLIGKLE